MRTCACQTCCFTPVAITFAIVFLVARCASEYCSQAVRRTSRSGLVNNNWIVPWVISRSVPSIERAGSKRKSASAKMPWVAVALAKASITMPTTCSTSVERTCAWRRSNSLMLWRYTASSGDCSIHWCNVGKPMAIISGSTNAIVPIVWPNKPIARSLLAFASWSVVSTS